MVILGTIIGFFIALGAWKLFHLDRVMGRSPVIFGVVLLVLGVVFHAWIAAIAGVGIVIAAPFLKTKKDDGKQDPPLKGKDQLR